MPVLRSVRTNRCATDYTVTTICKGEGQLDASCHVWVYRWCTFQRGEHAKWRPAHRVPPAGVYRKDHPAHTRSTCSRGRRRTFLKTSVDRSAWQLSQQVLRSIVEGELRASSIGPAATTRMSRPALIVVRTVDRVNRGQPGSYGTNLVETRTCACWDRA